MFWEKKYRDNKYLWGEGPSELGKIVIDYLSENSFIDKKLEILDIGCGYGRDVFFISKNIDCNILGIDSSTEAIKIAKNTRKNLSKEDITFMKKNFEELAEKKYDIILFSNFYQILKKDERLRLRNTISNIINRNGLVFLSTLSVNDPEHHGKGTPIPDELNSYQIGTHVHFCTKKELEEDFNFLKIIKIYEYEFFEPRANGETHHHKSWILIGENLIPNV